MNLWELNFVGWGGVDWDGESKLFITFYDHQEAEFSG